MPTPRWFVAGPNGIRVLSAFEAFQHMGISDDVIAGYDLCSDAGMNMERIAPLLVAAHDQGRDAEAFARHLVKLRAGLQGTRR